MDMTVQRHPFLNNGRNTVSLLMPTSAKRLGPGRPSAQLSRVATPEYSSLTTQTKAVLFRMVLKDDFVTVAEAFQSKGYQTIGAVGNPNAKVRFGMGQGFNHYNEPDKTFRKHVSLPSGGELVEDVLSQTKGLDRPFFAQLVFCGQSLAGSGPFAISTLVSRSSEASKRIRCKSSKNLTATLLSWLLAFVPSTPIPSLC